MTDHSGTLRGWRWQWVGVVFVGLIVAWAVVVTIVMLADDPASFHCGKSACNATDVALLLARNAAVVAWLISPYFLAAWALAWGAYRVNPAMPRWLRFQARMLPAVRAIFVVLLTLWQMGAAFVTYMMLEHNPQNTYCAHIGSAAEGNYYGYGPCRIGLGELTLLFAQNVYAVGVVIVPFALLAWVIVRLILSIETDRSG